MSVILFSSFSAARLVDSAQIQARERAYITALSAGKGLTGETDDVLTTTSIKKASDSEMRDMRVLIAQSS